MVSWVVAGVLAVHGVIHLMGCAKAFGYAELPQLTQPVSRAGGLAWLAAASLVLVVAHGWLTEGQAAFTHSSSATRRPGLRDQ